MVEVIRVCSRNKESAIACIRARPVRLCGNITLLGFCVQSSAWFLKFVKHTKYSKQQCRESFQTSDSSCYISHVCAEIVQDRNDWYSGKSITRLFICCSKDKFLAHGKSTTTECRCGDDD